MVGEKRVAGDEAKKRGNDAFGRGDYAEAVGLYTEAIMQGSSNPVYYLNRSMAYMRLNKYTDAERDASAALRLDGKNVKAFFRRASARKQLEKWQEAKTDFERVLVLDPGNKDAKAELVTVSQELSEREKRVPRQPLDVRDKVVGDKPISSATAQQATVSTVEAARRFLEQADVKDSAQASQTTIKPKDGDRNMPDRFPGESGSFLREISTRRIDRSASGPVKALQASVASKDASEPKLQAPYGSRKKSSADTREHSEVGAAPLVDDSKQIGLPPRGTIRLSAYEFNRRLRQCSSENEGPKMYSSQLAFLSSLDMRHFTVMMGSLLEPELLAEILTILSQAGHEMRSLVADVMSVLPQCDRFETAWMFLTDIEKSSKWALGEMADPSLASQASYFPYTAARDLFKHLRSHHAGDDKHVVDVIDKLWRGKLGE